MLKEGVFNQPLTVISSNFTVTKYLLNDTMIKEQNTANKSKNRFALLRIKQIVPLGGHVCTGANTYSMFFIFVLPGAVCFRINAGLRGHS